MATDRIQRRLDRLLDQVDEAEASGNWKLVHDLSRDVLAIDSENKEAIAYLDAAGRRLGTTAANEVSGVPEPDDSASFTKLSSKALKSNLSFFCCSSGSLSTSR